MCLSSKVYKSMKLEMVWAVFITVVFASHILSLEQDKWCLCVVWYVVLLYVCIHV